LGISPHERSTRRLSAPQEAVKVRVLDKARSFGVDLTPESANVSGLRRRVPWSQIQAVLGYRQMGADRMALALDSGERVSCACRPPIGVQGPPPTSSAGKTSIASASGASRTVARPGARPAPKHLARRSQSESRTVTGRAEGRADAADEGQ
jgi:hypothetical protein